VSYETNRRNLKSFELKFEKEFQKTAHRRTKKNNRKLGTIVEWLRRRNTDTKKIIIRKK